MGPADVASFIRETDRLFEDSPDSGSLACLCSRCGKRINEIGIRVWPDEGHEYRYHADCATAGLGET